MFEGWPALGWSRVALASSLGMSSMLSLINQQTILGLLSWQWQDPSLQASCGLRLRTDTSSLLLNLIGQNLRGGKRLCLLFGGAAESHCKGKTQRGVENCGHFCCSVMSIIWRLLGGPGCQDSLTKAPGTHPSKNRCLLEDSLTPSGAIHLPWIGALDLVVDICNPGYRCTVAYFACILASDTCTFLINFQHFPRFIQNNVQSGN